MNHTLLCSLHCLVLTSTLHFNYAISRSAAQLTKVRTNSRKHAPTHESTWWKKKGLVQEPAQHQKFRIPMKRRDATTIAPALTPICHNRPMCGRYRLSRRKQIIEEHFDSISGEEDWIPRYNVAPTQPVPIIRQNPKEPVRQLSLVRWGLIPSWALNRRTLSRMRLSDYRFF